MNNNLFSDSYPAYLAKQLLQAIPENEEGILETTLTNKDFPKLSKRIVGPTLFGLHRQNVIIFENWRDIDHELYRSDHSELWLEEFKLSLRSKTLQEFLDAVRHPTLGIDCENQDAAAKLTLLLNRIVRSSKNTIGVNTLNQDELGTLIYIADHTGAIDVVMSNEAEADTDEDGRQMINSGLVFKLIVIKDREKLQTLFNSITQHQTKGREKDIERCLKQSSHCIRWVCSNCGGFLEELKDRQQIASYMSKFEAGVMKKCKKCKTENGFMISEEGFASVSGDLEGIPIDY